MSIADLGVGPGGVLAAEVDIPVFRDRMSVETHSATSVRLRYFDTRADFEEHVNARLTEFPLHGFLVLKPTELVHVSRPRAVEVESIVFQ